MTNPIRLTALALSLATPVFSLAQPAPAPMPIPLPTVPKVAVKTPAPVVPMAMPAATPSAVPPVIAVPTPPVVSVPTPAPAPMVMTLPTAPTSIVMPQTVEAPTVEEPKAEDEQTPEEKFLLENLLGTTCGGQRLLNNGWRIYGWTQGTLTGGTVGGSNLPVPFTDRAREYSLNQNYLHVEKTIDTEKKERQLGGAVDLILPGTDSRFTISRGLMDRQLGRTQYPIDLFQAYGDFYAPNIGPNGTTFRGGKFATFLEYETVQAISTPFASRSYLFQYNPFTHTGGLAITPLNDNWTMQNGLVLGNDNFFGANASRLTYVGQLKWAPKEGKTSVAFGTSVTDPRFDAANAFAFYNVYNLQVTHKLTEKLSYAADASFSHMDAIPGVGSANWYGVVQYLFWDMTEKVQPRVRVELFEDSKGVRTGTAGLYTAVTGGVQLKVRPWLIVQPEIRYDNASRGTPFRGDRDLLTYTLGGIIRW